MVPLFTVSSIIFVAAYTVEYADVCCIPCKRLTTVVPCANLFWGNDKLTVIGRIMGFPKCWEAAESDRFVTKICHLCTAAMWPCPRWRPAAVTSSCVYVTSLRTVTWCVWMRARCGASSPPRCGGCYRRGGASSAGRERDCWRRAAVGRLLCGSVDC